MLLVLISHHSIDIFKAFGDRLSKPERWLMSTLTSASTHMGECTRTHMGGGWEREVRKREGDRRTEGEGRRETQRQRQKHRDRRGRGLCSTKGHPISEHLKLYAVNKDKQKLFLSVGFAYK